MASSLTANAHKMAEYDTQKQFICCSKLLHNQLHHIESTWYVYFHKWCSWQISDNRMLIQSHGAFVQELQLKCQKKQSAWIAWLCLSCCVDIFLHWLFLCFEFCSYILRFISRSPLATFWGKNEISIEIIQNKIQSTFIWKGKQLAAPTKKFASSFYCKRSLLDKAFFCKIVIYISVKQFSNFISWKHYFSLGSKKGIANISMSFIWLTSFVKMWGMSVFWVILMLQWHI